ncbi:hypothetical protein [Mesorhizobium sp. M0482]|uniref:hypothetical protein n=1 Tax=Mesorhizobium sp. M0482 TaxID=2956948 RepID=UPI00333A980F
MKLLRCGPGAADRPSFRGWHRDRWNEERKANVKSASSSILWEGGLGETAPYQTGSPPLSTLAQEILMAGCDSKARHTRLILNSKAQDNVLHLAARYA